MDPDRTGFDSRLELATFAPVGHDAARVRIPRPVKHQDQEFCTIRAMLKGISPALSPDLLMILAEMGHGDELVITDAHFPGHSTGLRVLRADGMGVKTLLDGILALFPLDTYDDPLYMMAPVEGDSWDPAIEPEYMAIVHRHEPWSPAPTKLERFDFYERAAQAYAVLVTGDRRKYANIILKKGVVLE